eukprot:3741215-Prymnesium_polylepis.2
MRGCACGVMCVNPADAGQPEVTVQTTPHSTVDNSEKRNHGDWVPPPVAPIRREGAGVTVRTERARWHVSSPQASASPRR